MGLPSGPKMTWEGRERRLAWRFLLWILFTRVGLRWGFPYTAGAHMLGISHQHQRKELRLSNQLAQFQDVRGRGKNKVGNCQQTSKNGVQSSCSVVSDSLRPHGLQHTRPPCPSPAPGVCSNSCPLSQWCQLIQPSRPLSSPSPPAFNLSQHQGLF